MMESRRDKATIIDALKMVRSANDHGSLCKAVEEIDRMFLADTQEIVMSDQDWKTLNSAIAASPFHSEGHRESAKETQSDLFSAQVRHIPRVPVGDIRVGDKLLFEEQIFTVTGGKNGFVYAEIVVDKYQTTTQILSGNDAILAKMAALEADDIFSPQNLPLSARKSEGAVQEGIFNGMVMSIVDGIVTQRVNREGKTVQHDVNRLSMSVKVDEAVQIKYEGGVGQVTKEQVLGVRR